jgi:putative transposase
MGVTPSYNNLEYGTVILINGVEDQYPQVCFNYIHQNHVKVGLINDEINWEFCSALDYAEKRNGTLVNKAVANLFVVI